MKLRRKACPVTFDMLPNGFAASKVIGAPSFVIYRLQRQQTPVERQPLPQELATILALQSNNGQWRPSNRLIQALGGKVPDPPPGVQDWRWATALAVIALRRRPDAVDDTFEAYR